MKSDKILNENLWDIHLSRQFHWTRNLRKKIYDEIGLREKKLILDAGCGIGLISREMYEISKGEVYGIDINRKLIEKAEKNFPEGKFMVASVEELPFEDNFFDVTFCHFLLMWVKNPYKAMMEMKRVTKPKGWIVCCAEPDYGGKIDYPDDYGAGQSTIRTLQSEGADPFLGRKLKAIFVNAELKPKMGVFADLWNDEKLKEEFEHIWKFSLLTAKGNLQRQWALNIQKRDKEALEKGERITFLPIFWGIAQKV